MIRESAGSLDSATRFIDQSLTDGMDRALTLDQDMCDLIAAGTLVAALSVSGPAFRMSRDTLLDQVVPMLLASADDLSRQLGHQGYQE